MSLSGVYKIGSYPVSTKAGDTKNTLKVQLKGARSQIRVIFNVTPDISESRTVEYKQLTPIHMPGSIQLYHGSSSRTFNLSAIKIMSRTSKEAGYNLELLNVLRAWGMPSFGKSPTNKSVPERGFEPILGSPPEVLLLTAYSDANNKGNLFEIPVVLTSLTIPYPSDVDYIPAMRSDGKTLGPPMPTLMTIDMTLVETHSPSELSSFSLEHYRSGDLSNF